MKLRALSFVLLSCMLLMGCSNVSCVEYLKQSTENIIGIELIYNQTGEKREVLYTLTDEQLSDFIMKLSELRIGEHREPHGSLGYLVIELIYKDGSIQKIGTQSSKYINAQETDDAQFDDRHYIRYSEMYELFSQYVGDEVLSALKQR